MSITPPGDRNGAPPTITITDVVPHVLFAGRTNLIFVEVRTDAGITGVGEASLEGKTEAVVGAIHDIRDYLIGNDATRIEHHWQTVYRHSFWRGGVVILSALSGIEQALWDILGKALEVPVYDLAWWPSAGQGAVVCEWPPRRNTRRDCGIMRGACRSGVGCVETVALWRGAGIGWATRTAGGAATDGVDPGSGGSGGRCPD